MIKKIMVRAGILTAVFVAAVIVFSYLTNQGNTSMSADMGAAQLPRISFVTGEYEVNSLPGYEENMEMTSMRDTVTPVNGGVLKMQIENAESEIPKLTWQVYTLDGEECLQQETIEKVGDTLELKISGSGILLEERALRITLHFEDRDVYYYTRIKSDAECNYSTCMDYVKQFHENAIAKTGTDMIQTAIETNSSLAGSGFQDVNIYSTLDTVTWGDLKPTVMGNVSYEVKECNENYTSVMLSYRVTCPELEADEGAQYSVKEFFRVRLYGERVYLLDYQRDMEQIFDGNKNALDLKGVILGIASSDVEYKNNADGTIVSFVQNRELWNYNREVDELSLVFSFADAEGMDERNLYEQHEVHIIEVEDNGSTAFTVTGYMNRGEHEGQVGVAVYYFDSEKSSVEEKAFVPTRKGYQIMKEELGKYVYYSHENEMLYVMIDGTLYAIDLDEDTRDVLVRGLEEGQYVASEDGSLVAFQNTGGKLYESQKVKVLNLKTGEGFDIQSEGDSYVLPIGFIKNDLAYGFMRKSDMGTTLVGETIYPMYKVEIVNQDQKVVKTYEVPNIFIMDFLVEDNMLTLGRAEKTESQYVNVADDYITNNEETEESNIYLDSYSDEIKGLQYRLVYDDGISDDNPKVLNPKLVLKEQTMTLRFDEAGVKEKYYVYAFGKLQGIYEKESHAIQQAEKLEGVAVTYRQAYLWEKGNLPTLYEVNNMEAFGVKEGQSSLAACLERMLLVEEKEVDVQEDLDAGLTPKEILSKYSGGEGIDLTGCTVEHILYTISRETPVLTFVGEGRAVLLTGYNKTNVVYLDPTTGERKSVTKAEMESMINSMGNILIGYAK